MADQLLVDPDALEGFGTRLDNIKNALDSSKHTIDSYDDAYGSDKVRDAMHHFEGHWHDGRKHVESTAEALAGMAHESAKQIRKTDSDLKKSLEDGTKNQTVPVVKAK